MKRMNGLSFALAVAAVALCASTCEKMEPGDYRDHLGNKINLLGGWILSEVQYKTAGIIESRGVDAQSVMEFAGDGLGYTKSFSGAVEGVVSVERDRIYHLIDPVKPRLEVK